MENKIITLPAFYVAGLSVRTTNANSQAEKDIGALWQAFTQQNIAVKLSNKLSNELYCVYTDYQTDHTGPYTAILGYKVSSIDNLPEGITGVSIAKSNYLVFTPEGAFPASLGNAWQYIWQADIDRKYTADFDIYHLEGDGFANIRSEIYVAV
jgi:predicted transcriptional regulator YdeE